LKEPILIIANPSAGASAGRANRRRVLEAVRHDLRKHGIPVHIGIEDSSRAVAERAEAAALGGAPIVVAAGGDGTVNAVLNGIMRASRGGACPAKLGVLPLGTGNVFAYNMGIPRNWREACAVLRTGEVRRIDVGLARPLPESQAPRKRVDGSPDFPEERYFLLMAGIGFDAKVIEDTSLRLKFVLRDFAYVLRSLQNAVVHRGTQMSLDFEDGRNYANLSWLMMVGNAASYAWNIKFTEQAELEDGFLDVCLFPYQNKLVSVQQVMQLLIGQHVESGAVEYWKTKSLVVESDPPVPVQLDGDEWGTTPLELSILPGVLDVLAPSTQLVATG
jgi:YegS/Rv2252/BmrU family lipid kinase